MYSMSFFVPETSEFMFKPKTSSFYNQIVEPASPLPIIDLDLPSILHDVEKSDKYSFAYDLSLPSILHDVEKPDKSSFANEPLRTYASVNEKSSYVSGNPNPKFEMNKTGQKSRKIIPSNMKSYLDPKTVNGLHSSMLSKELRTEPEKSKKTYAYM